MLNFVVAPSLRMNKWEHFGARSHGHSALSCHGSLPGCCIHTDYVLVGLDLAMATVQGPL